MSYMYDSKKFGQRLSELRKKKWEQYKNNLSKRNNPYEKFACCRTQESLAEALGLERRTIGKWELGISTPTIDKVSALCDLLECKIDYLLGADELVGFSTSVYASHFSGISIDIINYAMKDADYLEFLNYFMHPDNCSALIKSITMTAWKDFLFEKELVDLAEPLKSLIIDTFHSYQAFTPATKYSKDSFREYIISSLPKNRFSFATKKLDERICVRLCLSPSKIKELGLSSKNSQSYQTLIDYIVDYSFDILTTKEILDIQKENLGRLFIHMLEKYLAK